jgi:hypothetical protein
MTSRSPGQQGEPPYRAKTQELSTQMTGGAIQKCEPSLLTRSSNSSKGRLVGPSEHPEKAFQGREARALPVRHPLASRGEGEFQTGGKVATPKGKQRKPAGEQEHSQNSLAVSQTPQYAHPSAYFQFITTLILPQATNGTQARYFFAMANPKPRSNAASWPLQPIDPTTKPPGTTA